MQHDAISTCTDIQLPLQVADASSLQWDDQCDVLVIGWGAAGACAALEARARGAAVLVADRFTGGGASAKSGGVVYAGGGTRQQRDAGATSTHQHDQQAATPRDRTAANYVGK